MMQEIVTLLQLTRHLQMRTSAWQSQSFVVNISILPFRQQILNLTFIADLRNAQNENPDAGKSTMTPIAVLPAKMMRSR